MRRFRGVARLASELDTGAVGAIAVMVGGCVCGIAPSVGVVGVAGVVGVVGVVAAPVDPGIGVVVVPGGVPAMGMRPAAVCTNVGARTFAGGAVPPAGIVAVPPAGVVVAASVEEAVVVVAVVGATGGVAGRTWRFLASACVTTPFAPKIRS
jgi:hypothetical protein